MGFGSPEAGLLELDEVDLWRNRFFIETSIQG